MKTRAFHAVTAISAIAGVIVALTTAGAKQIGNQLAYFTELSNIVIAIVCTILAFRPKLATNWFAALRLDSLVCIVITALVYHAVLASQDNPEGWAVVSNFLLHSLTPLLTIAGWVFLGPRDLFPKRTVSRAVFVPILWVIATFIRGAIDNYYPYDFMNVVDLGYRQALLNVVVIIAMFFAFCALARWADKWLVNGSRSSQSAAE